MAFAMKAANGLENVSDVIETDLVRLGFSVLQDDIRASESMRYLYNDLGDKLSDALKATVWAIEESDQRAAEDMLNMKSIVDKIVDQAMELQSIALINIDKDKIKILQMEMSALESLKRIYTHLRRIARELVPQEIRG